MMRIGNYDVPNKNRKVAINTQFASDDLGGDTSATDSAHNGIKPKEITVNFIIPFEDEAEITAFYAVAEATDELGDLVAYELIDSGANAANIRQVKFSSSISQRELNEINAWQMAFTLREYRSVAEKIEQRQSQEVAAVPVQSLKNINDVAQTAIDSSLAFTQVS